MATFPALKTGAITQYPATVKTSFGRTRVVEFLDGSSQKYSIGAPPLRQWTIHLDRLDPRESATIADFVRDNTPGTFAFTDPLTGTVIPRCGLHDLEVQNTLVDELSEQTTFVIEELP